MTRFAIDTLQLHGVGMAAAVTLRGVGGVSHRLNRQTVGPDSGNPYDEARFTLDIDDEFTFGQVMALESLLDNVNALTGFCITDDGTHPGLKLFGQSYSRCGTNGRGAGGTHAQILATLAHVFLDEISGSRNQFASASVRVVNMLETGATRPTAAVYNASLPGTYVVDEMFKIGPVQLDGALLDEDAILSMSVNMNRSIQIVKNLDGYAVDILILKVQPTIRITLDDSTVLADSVIPYEGLPISGADSWVSWLALDPDGTVFARDASAHVKCLVTGKAYVEDHMTGGGNQPATNTIVIETIDAGGGSFPLVFTTDTALEGGS